MTTSAGGRFAHHDASRTVTANMLTGVTVHTGASPAIVADHAHSFC